MAVVGPCAVVLVVMVVVLAVIVVWCVRSNRTDKVYFSPQQTAARKTIHTALNIIKMGGWTSHAAYGERQSF